MRFRERNRDTNANTKAEIANSVAERGPENSKVCRSRSGIGSGRLGRIGTTMPAARRAQAAAAKTSARACNGLVRYLAQDWRRRLIL